MGIRIIKAGLADSIQDMGRYGYQHLGIPPAGVMDTIAAGICNALMGNAIHEPVLEMHFPAAVLYFERSMMIALSGADFGAQINGVPIELNQPILVPAEAELRFVQHKKGARVYLAVEQGFNTEKWLNSGSTAFIVSKGGVAGRYLKQYDLIECNQKEDLEIDELTHLPWRAGAAPFYPGNTIACIPGKEFPLLEKISQLSFKKNSYKVGLQSSRMGYRLEGQALLLSEQKECVSSAVSFGTIQLLPNAQMIILMADHQTTGGYPQVAHVASHCLPSLAQVSPGESIRLEMISIETAENLFVQQQQDLQQLQNACNFKLQEYFSNE